MLMDKVVAGLIILAIIVFAWKHVARSFKPIVNRPVANKRTIIDIDPVKTQKTKFVPPSRKDIDRRIDEIREKNRQQISRVDRTTTSTVRSPYDNTGRDVHPAFRTSTSNYDGSYSSSQSNCSTSDDRGSYSDHSTSSDSGSSGYDSGGGSSCSGGGD